MLRIVRRGDRHDPRDLTVSLRFEGDFGAAFREGHAEGLVPSEPLKNLVHGAARQHASGDIETFGLALSREILAALPRITRVRIEIAEQPWTRVEAGGKAQGQAFLAAGPEQRTATITSGQQTAVVSGIDQLVVMRTSGFTPPRSDDDLSDRLQPLVVGSLSARWTYSTGDVTFGPYRQAIRAAILGTFAQHASRSIHYTLYAIADVVLASHQEITDITLTMHERPYRPTDMFRASVEKPDELFVAVEESCGVVEVTVERDAGGPATRDSST
jgi:urate oxidase